MAPLLAAPGQSPSDSISPHTASVLLVVATVVLVAVGMARPPLVSDRIWRFLCWSGATFVGLWAAARMGWLGHGSAWAGFAVLVSVILALLFLLEHEREQRSLSFRISTAESKSNRTIERERSALDTPTDAPERAVAAGAWESATELTRGGERALLTATESDPRQMLSVKFRYDEEGFLRVGLENKGQTVDAVGLNLLAPRNSGRAYAYRVDPTTGHQSTAGHYDEVDHRLIQGTPKSVRWIEHGLKVFGYSVTEWKFFLPYVQGDPIYFKVGGDALKGWTDDWIAITPATLTGSKATKSFGPDRSAAAGLAVDQHALVTSLIAEGSALLPQTVDTTHADGSRAASTRPGSGDWQGANAWLRRAREAMRLHYGEQAYRVAPDLDQDASSAQVAAAIERTMPALQNWRNSLH